MTKPLDLQSKFGKPMQQLEKRMISVLSGYGDGEWFSLTKLVKAMRLPSNFALQDDVPLLVAQRLATWNWYRKSNRWGYGYIRRKHSTAPKLIILANRQNIRTDASWPPYETTKRPSERDTSEHLTSILDRKHSKQMHEIV